MTDRALIIGVGNAWRGDDAVGLHVAREIATRGIPGVTVLAEDLDGAALLMAWGNAATIVVVDATCSGGSPGTITRFDAVAGPIPASTFATSTHALGVTQAVELGRALGRLPERLIVIGVEGSSFSHRQSLSPAVEEAVAEAAARVLDEIEAGQRPGAGLHSKRPPRGTSMTDNG